MIKTRLFINGEWTAGQSGQTFANVNPANGQEIGSCAFAEPADIESAAQASAQAFQQWRKVPALSRYNLLRAAANDLRSRAEEVARVLTLEHGKPLAEARLEVGASADIIDFFAEEGRRAYGRIIPARMDGVRQYVFRDPVGPVAAFSPWNFPIGQSVRKISAALATGCTIVLKGPEDTPASCAELVKSFENAGVPDGVLNLVFGNPAAISERLITHPAIRKITFTVSTAVGKSLAAMAGQYMKRVTMELGGHAPAIICEDAEIDKAVQWLAGSKFRNAGQICASPSRLLIHSSIYDEFVSKFVEKAQSIKVGDGLEEGTQMGPLAHSRRLQSMEKLVRDAREKGAEVATGGQRIGDEGCFYAPTVLLNITKDMLVLNEEPFGPIAPIMAFENLDEAIAEANRLDFGLAAYAFSQSEKSIRQITSEVQSGMLSVNHVGLALPETPFGGIKDSGYGSEGGPEALDPYLLSRFVTQAL